MKMGENENDRNSICGRPGKAIDCSSGGNYPVISTDYQIGFWLINSMLEIDEKTTLKSWTMMETIIGFTGLICALIISVFA